MKSAGVWALAACCAATSCAKILGIDGLDYTPGPAGATCFADDDCVSKRCADGRCAVATPDGGGGQDGGCSASDPWSPTKTTSEVDGDAASLALYLHQTGKGAAVNLYVCKDGGFNNPDIFVHIVDQTENHSGLVLFDGLLQTQHATCTDYSALTGADDFAAGEQLGGTVTIVSPGAYYSMWGDGCALGGGGFGSCFTGSTQLMTRTCW
jgi:hypothetical protein